jgi:hypothetical protein
MLAGTTPGNRVRLRPSLRAATNAAAISSADGVLISTSLVCTHLGDMRTKRYDDLIRTVRLPRLPQLRSRGTGRSIGGFLLGPTRPGSPQREQDKPRRTAALVYNVAVSSTCVGVSLT